MACGSKLGVIVIAAVLIFVILMVIIFNCSWSSSSSSSTSSSGTDSDDMPVCEDVQNVYEGKKLENVRLNVQNCDDKILSPVALKFNGKCHLGDSCHPLTVVDKRHGCETSWTFTDDGFLEYNNRDYMNSYGSKGHEGHYYVTYSSPLDKDARNSLEKWYGNNLKGDAYAAGLTLADYDKSAGCNYPVCIHRDVENGYVYCYIDDKKFYLTANRDNNNVFWYEHRDDHYYDNNQRWCIKFSHPKTTFEDSDVLRAGKKAKSEFGLRREFRDF